MTAAAIVAILGLVAAVLFTRKAVRWGATDEECAATMPGDAYLDDPSRARVAMTRAVTIAAPTDTVWPWLAQVGRGAGWYSWERIDNGGKPSADHIVQWIPAPQLGDASPIGYLCHLEPGSAITWWASGVRFLGSTARLAFDIRLTPQGDASRLVIRISADAKGGLPRTMLTVFRFLDSVMACRQLVGIRRRAERFGARAADPDRPETGARDQYQHFEVVFASGERAGSPGRQDAAKARSDAEDLGLVATPPREDGRGDASKRRS